MALQTIPNDPNPPARIVVIDDVPAIASLTVDAIQTGIRGSDTRASHFNDASLSDLVARADVCVCSGGASPEAMFDALTRLLRLRPDLAVVILLPACAALGGWGGKAAVAVRLGAADVLLRVPGYLTQLPIVLQRVIMHRGGVGYAGQRLAALRATLAGIENDNSSLRSLVARLESLAATDPLTGLLNRRALDAAMVRAFAASKRYGHELSCLALDVDGFKGVNDTLGHAHGDDLLRLLAASIIAECRQSDIAGRPGGDEFVVLLPHTGPVEAAAVAQRLRRRFDREAGELCLGAGGTCNVGLSIGVASRAAHGLDSPDAVLAAADGALYAAKRSGRDAVRIADVRPSTPALRRAG